MHKYNMGIIGNCSFLAYIDLETNVQWMCMPKFDSSFVFGSLLDKEKGGSFKIRSNDDKARYKQYYLENTNILCTECTSSNGVFRVIDFAPRFNEYDRNFKPLMMIRKIELLEGSPHISIECRPMCEYGEVKPKMAQGSNHISFSHSETTMRLTTDISLNYIMSEKSFVLSGTQYLVFTYGNPMEAPLQTTCELFLQKTKVYWSNWVKSTFIPNFHQQFVIRSALALKLHQYEDTGGIIASGTTSLPEFNGSTRNWDYRYCWMRDAYYTLMAFNSMGHFEELEKYFRYIENIIHTEENRIQPLYSITGEKFLHEKELDLEGYLEANKPVRIGNDAYSHIQNDVYGQVLASILPLYIDKRLSHTSFKYSQEIVQKMANFLEKTIHEEDAGIWEFRNKKQFHCYTFLFQWVGAKAIYKIASYFNNEKLMSQANVLIQKASDKIEACYSQEQQAYCQAIGSNYMDASCLQLITLNYIDPASEKARLHLKAIEKKLVTEDGLVYRYLHEDDFGKPHTTFVICAFWYVEALACVGRLEESQNIFENLIKKTTNHVGLISEDIGEDGSQWGNFPQTYSHVGLMNAAYRIARKLDKPMFY